MKKLNAIILVISVLLLITSCNKDKKKTEIKEEVKKSLTIDKSSIEIKWTAYKTTDKVAVSGVFNHVTITNENGNILSELLNGLEFSIPVSSIFSNNDDRDSKLQEFFFGVMDNTTLLNGSISVDSEKNIISNVTMNGVTESVALTKEIKDKIIHLSGVIDLEKWNAFEAIESINKACFDLHKGADGISKTWTDVKIDISFSIK